MPAVRHFVWREALHLVVAGAIAAGLYMMWA